jgi:hypothetical protein
MRKKIKIVAYSLLSISAVGALYVAAQLTKLKDSDILEVHFDEDEEDLF